MKKILFCVFAFLLAGVGFAESFGLEILKKSSLSVEAPFFLTAGDILNYAKANNGVQVMLDTELMNFNSKTISAGICSTYFYNKYAFIREEIDTFYIQGVTEGLWVEYSLPYKLLHRSELSAGLANTRVKAESIYEKKIDNNYNSLVIGINSTVRRQLFDAKVLSFLVNAGLNIKIYKEEDSVNSDIGLMAGLTVKAGKKWK